MSRTVLALLTALALPLALGLPACRGAGSTSLTTPVPREFERTFEAEPTATWRAAISAVHAAGLVVPEDARLTDEGGEIESGDLRLRVEPTGEGDMRVGARFLGYPIAEQEQRARDLLADIARRLE
jgi:hypothetical protein